MLPGLVRRVLRKDNNRVENITRGCLFFVENGDQTLPSLYRGSPLPENLASID